MLPAARHAPWVDMECLHGVSHAQLNRRQAKGADGQYSALGCCLQCDPMCARHHGSSSQAGCFSEKLPGVRLADPSLEGCTRHSVPFAVVNPLTRGCGKSGWPILDVEAASDLFLDIVSRFQPWPAQQVLLGGRS